MSIISERLKNVRRVIAVSSGKGGVGKSLVATTLALALSRKGCRVGLFDLDFTSPSTHIVLGAKDAKPTEDRGLVPPVVCGLRFMSLVYYSGDQPAPLRGADTSNVLLELLAVTLWGDLDYLVIDMPPGIGDAVLDLVRFVSKIEFLIVTTPSQLAFETVRKQVCLLKELGIPIIGVVENMKMATSQGLKPQIEALGLSFLGEIPFDSAVEGAIGDPGKLLCTSLGRKVEELAQTV